MSHKGQHPELPPSPGAKSAANPNLALVSCGIVHQNAQSTPQQEGRGAVGFPNEAGRTVCVADADDEDVEDREQVLFQGPLYGREANLKKNPRLVQVGLIPVKRMISDALSRRAHTVKLEPVSGRMAVRIVVDGIPYPAGALAGQRGAAVAQMIKLLAGLDTRNRAEPQRGGIRAEFDDHQYRLLVDTTPVQGGTERLRIRIEDVKESFVRPGDVGFPEDLKAQIRRMTHDASGIFLACGPPESGVTSLSMVALHCMDPYLYSVYNLAELGDRQLVNVTDFDTEGSTDLEVTLDRIIRAEGDAVFIGRLADPHTAQLLFQFSDRLCFFGEIAARTPVDALKLLIDWVGVDQVLSGLKGVLTQKLIRRLCDDCEQAYRPSPQMLARLSLPRETTVLYRPPSAPPEDDPEAPTVEELCADCNGVPYHGRVAAYELLEITDTMKEVLAAGGDSAAVRKQMLSEKQRVLQQDALRLVVEGITSLEELQRVFSPARDKRKPRPGPRRRPQSP